MNQNRYWNGRRTLVILLLVLAVHAHAGPGGETLEFTAPVGDLLLQLGEAARHCGDTVGVSLPGKDYRPTFNIRPVPLARADYSNPESSESVFYSANRVGSLNRIMEVWARNARKAVRMLLVGHLAKNTEISLMIEERELIGKVFYGDFVLLLVKDTFRDGRVSLTPHAYVLEDGEWRITNALSGDEQFDIVATSLRSGSASLLQ